MPSCLRGHLEIGLVVLWTYGTVGRGLRRAQSSRSFRAAGVTTKSTTKVSLVKRSMSRTRQVTAELTKTLALACPIMAGQVGQMLMGLVDTVMVGHVGTSSLAAAAFANGLFSVAFVFGIGVLASVGVLVSQAHGAGMDGQKRVILRSSIWLSVLVGVVLATILTLVQPWLSVF